ncbi:MAG TPA: LAGLIDADG endonuclease [Candidatus Paceibacterota bacterium]
MDNIVGRLQSAFPSHQLDVIIGSLLGDARLECRSKGIRASYTARFRVHHGDKQKEYVWWKYEILKDLVSKEPKEITLLNKKRNLKEVSCYFHTKSLKNFGIIHEIFYKNGVKKFPVEILPVFSPQMLAVWYMDDGSNNHGNVTLSTHSFSLEDQHVIADFLKEKYHINPTIVKDRNQWKISIGSYDYNRFLSIVAPFVPKAMNYKIDNPRIDLSKKLGRAFAEEASANTSVPEVENLEKV